MVGILVFDLKVMMATVVQIMALIAQSVAMNSYIINVIVMRL